MSCKETKKEEKEEILIESRNSWLLLVLNFVETNDVFDGSMVLGSETGYYLNRLESLEK